MADYRPILLAILDGWGIGKNSETNAVNVARTPNMDRWMRERPYTTLTAHNGLVGLPEGQMGNSEVGHLNIGAGRIVYQDYTRINKAVESGEFAENKTLNDLFHTLKQNNGALHLLGLLSDGGVHSHLNHLLAILQAARDKGLKKIYIHAFMDGRDTPPSSGIGYMRTLKNALDEIGCGRVATVSGRYYAMDRDNRWDRVEKAWLALVNSKGERAGSAIEAMQNSYDRQESDEFVKPTVICDDAGQPVGQITDGDGILFFNFRADRARELTKAFTQKEFNGFQTGNRPQLSSYVTMTEYEADFNLPILFPPMSMEHILGEVISEQGMRQLRIAETEKYAHVTYFFNGGEEDPYPGEDRVLIDSPKDVATYDQKPAMSAREVTDKLLSVLQEKENAGTPYDLIVLNFANGDMVGHTGIFNAAVQACETVDECMGRIQHYMDSVGGTILITADHGNAELMVNPESGEPYTAHTLNPVPFILLNETLQHCSLREGGALKDIAPTILELLHIDKPEAMEGVSLIQDI